MNSEACTSVAIGHPDASSTAIYILYKVVNLMRRTSNCTHKIPMKKSTGLTESKDVVCSNRCGLAFVYTASYYVLVPEVEILAR
jgi:hypothetical protein